MTATEKQIAFLQRNNVLIPTGLTKAAAHQMISQMIPKAEEEKVEVVKPGEVASSKRDWSEHHKQPERTATMYASYAKDIFVAMNPGSEPNEGAGHLMEIAIKLVKQAKEAFE